MNLLVEETIEEMRLKERPNYVLYFRHYNPTKGLTLFENWLAGTCPFIEDEKGNRVYFVLRPKVN